MEVNLEMRQEAINKKKHFIEYFLRWYYKQRSSVIIFGDDKQTKNCLPIASHFKSQLTDCEKVNAHFKIVSLSSANDYAEAGFASFQKRSC